MHDLNPVLDIFHGMAVKIKGEVPTGTQIWKKGNVSPFPRKDILEGKPDCGGDSIVIHKRRHGLPMVVPVPLSEGVIPQDPPVPRLSDLASSKYATYLELGLLVRHFPPCRCDSLYAGEGCNDNPL